MNFFAELDLKLYQEAKSLQALHFKCISLYEFCHKWDIALNLIKFFSSIALKIFKFKGGN